MIKTMRTNLLAVLGLALSLGMLQAAEHSTDVTQSPFGIGSCHTNNTSAQANARWVPQMAAIGITHQRTCHTSWGAV